MQEPSPASNSPYLESERTLARSCSGEPFHLEHGRCRLGLFPGGAETRAYFGKHEWRMNMPQVHEDTRGRRNGRAREALKARATDVMDDFSTLQRDMSRLASAANKATRAEVHSAGKRLENIGRQMRQRTASGISYVGDQVRSRPLATMGATLGAGLALGLFLTRRR